MAQEARVTTFDQLKRDELFSFTDGETWGMWFKEGISTARLGFNGSRPPVRIAVFPDEGVKTTESVDV